MDKREWVESCREYADLVDQASQSDAGEVAHDAGRELVIQALRLKRKLCTACNGIGRYVYTKGTMWRKDGKLQSVKDDTGKDIFFQIDVCQECWGSGSIDVRGVNLKHLQWLEEKQTEHIGRIRKNEIEKVELLNQIEKWKEASGLEVGGDPDGVTPEMARKYWDENNIRAMALNEQRLEERCRELEVENNAFKDASGICFKSQPISKYVSTSEYVSKTSVTPEMVEERIRSLTDLIEEWRQASGLYRQPNSVTPKALSTYLESLEQKIRDWEDASGLNLGMGVNPKNAKVYWQNYRQRFHRMEIDYDKCISTIRERDATITELQKELAIYKEGNER